MIPAPSAMVPAPATVNTPSGGSLRLATIHATSAMSAAPDTMSVTPIRTLRLAMAPAMSAIVPVPPAMSARRDAMSPAPDTMSVTPGSTPPLRMTPPPSAMIPVPSAMLIHTAPSPSTSTPGPTMVAPAPYMMSPAPTKMFCAPSSTPWWVTLPTPNAMDATPSAMNDAPISNSAAYSSSFVTKTALTVSTAAQAVKMLTVGPELNAATSAVHPAGTSNSGGPYRASPARGCSPRIQTVAVTTPERATAPASP